MNTIYNLRSKKYYSAKVSQQYEKDLPVGEQYRIYHETIKTNCLKRNGEFTVLELGCGTGRYFFDLENVQKLTGVDISEDMLRAARENVKRIPELSSVTDFVNSSIEDFNTDEKFDLIYSIGTLGEYCEFSVKILERVVSFLKPGGLFFFTIVDAESYVSTEHVGLKKRLYRFALKFLPLKLRIKFEAPALINDDWKELFLSRKQVEQILYSSGIPIKWELSKSRDSKHVHHLAKVRLADSTLN
jgi:SAM-dependent methyltransferase